MWEWGLSRSRGTGRVCCKAVADSFACYRWCWAQSNDERTDEFYPSYDVTGVEDLSSTPGLGKGVNAVKGIRLGRARFLWQRNDGKRLRSTLRWAGISEKVDVRYLHKLETVNC